MKFWISNTNGACVQVDITTDVVVAGSGMGGLVATVKALEEGADVILVEKGPRLGGTTIVTGGTVRFSNSEPLIDPYIPYEELFSWLTELGIRVFEPPRQWQEGYWERENYWLGSMKIDPPDFVNDMERIIRENGGEIKLRTPLTELITDNDDNVIGVKVRNSEGDIIRIGAESCILATGGFAGNEKLVEQFTGFNSQKIVLRRDPWSTGDGFLAALDVGAKTFGGLSKVNGHCMPPPPAEYSMEEFRDATQYYSPKGIAIDKNGRRFVDESTDSRENAMLQAAIDLGKEEIFYVIDDDVYNSTFPHEHAGTRVENARRFGGVVIETMSIDDLGDQMSDEGINGKTAVNTIKKFNENVTNGEGYRLDPPRLDMQEPLDSPPFYAVKVQPGISFFFGGLDVNENCQVLSRTASSSTMAGHISNIENIFFGPINGLYAAGIEVGRPGNPHLESGYYGGGLALGLATGYIAARHAAE